MLAEPNWCGIRAYREASRIGRRDIYGTRAVRGTVAATMNCIAGGFVPVMLRRFLTASIVRMCDRRLMASDAKTDRHRRNRTHRNERDQQEHD